MAIDRLKIFALGCGSFWVAILLGGSFGGRLAAASCLAMVGALLWPIHGSRRAKFSILMAGGLALLSLLVLSTAPSKVVVFSALGIGLLGLPWALLSFWGVEDEPEALTGRSKAISRKDVG